MTPVRHHRPDSIYLVIRSGILGAAVFGWLLTTLALATPAAARDPSNKSECVSTLRPLLETRCQAMFTDAEKRTACAQQVAPHVEQTCQQFFGQGRDFCATCTSSCTENFRAGDGKRRECLAMCLTQPGCK